MKNPYDLIAHKGIRRKGDSNYKNPYDLNENKTKEEKKCYTF